nr:immunoglobulin heavy chain junction region [Macaca mulatta]MOV38454.1 immunoglobulin heavy chain junction region [Macaca mulatta]MOV38664.1 immunoglobulin heavy chain junction region [Macaca mulatta]MOV38844.1 immunoglobulin heavy chain junction region [Macaca mulatta]MOV38985.1 immunoglobulin heavy chain junction region [Macaca mulatta]
CARDSLGSGSDYW